MLTHTYFLEEDEHEKRIMKPYPPLGLLYLSAFLKQRRIDVEVYDTTFSGYPALVACLEEKKPAILGIHCNMMTKYTVLKLIDYCREKGIISVLGGPDASTQVEEFLRYGADIIVSGQGEEPLLAALEALKIRTKHELFDIPNLSFKDGQGNIVQNPRQASRRQLDEYPFPDREAIDLFKYPDAWEKHHGQRPVSLITARGCAFTLQMVQPLGVRLNPPPPPPGESAGGDQRPDYLSKWMGVALTAGVEPSQPFSLPALRLCR